MTLIPYIIVLATIVVLISIPIFFAHKERKKPIKMMQNGVEITLSQEEFEEYKNNKTKNTEKEKPKNDHINIEAINNELNDNIRSILKKCDDRIKIKVLLELLDMKVHNENELDYKIWLFNAGDLRTNEEVMEYEYNIYCIKHQENFNRERHLVNIAAFFIPFTTVFLIVFFSVRIFKNLWFIGIPVSLIPATFAGIIGSIIGYSINVSNAKEYGLSNNDPRVQSEKLKQKVAIASGIVSTVTTTRHTKQAIKDFANVDSWKEFK